MDFVKLNKLEKGDKIAAALEDSLAGALESAFMGAANLNNYDPTGKAMTDIEDAFKVFLSSQEIEKLGSPGVPTQAAQDGVTPRLTHPYRKRAARPSGPRTCPRQRSCAFCGCSWTRSPSRVAAGTPGSSSNPRFCVSF